MGVLRSNKLFFVVLIFISLLLSGVACGYGQEGEVGEQNNPPIILFLPLDDRPECYDYVLKLGQLAGVQVMAPPKEMWRSGSGGGEREADPAELRTWVLEHAAEADAVVLSLDAALYGGLVPAREHDLPSPLLESRIAHLAQLGKVTGAPVYAYISLMRTTDVKERSWRAFPVSCDGSSSPLSYCRKSLSGRERSFLAAGLAVELVKEDIIDFLVIARDDCNAAGISRAEARELERKAESLGVADKVATFPGTDECGALLLARAVCELAGLRPAVYVEYGHASGPSLVPRYEDVPLEESVGAHIFSVGGCLETDPDRADLVLAINTPPEKVGEAVRQNGTYNRKLVAVVAEHLDEGRAVVLADVAYANGSDAALMEALARKGLLLRLAGYSGWNTAGNSVGLALAQGIIRSYAERSGGVGAGKRLDYLFHRLVVDWGYQAVVRPKMLRRYVGGSGAAVVLGPVTAGEAEEEIKKELNGFARTWLGNWPDGRVKEVEILDADLPWFRLADLGVELRITY